MDFVPCPVLRRSYNARCVCCYDRAIVNNSARRGGICGTCKWNLRLNNASRIIQRVLRRHGKQNKHYAICLILKRFKPLTTSNHIGSQVVKWL